MEYKCIGEFRFVNESGSSRSGFWHKSTLFKDGRPYMLGDAKHHYINRTWESYTYQTAMIDAVDNAIDKIASWLIDNYKYNNNIKRLTKDKKAMLLDNNSEIAELRELRGLL